MSPLIPPPLPPDIAAAAQKIINDMSVGFRQAIWSEISTHSTTVPPPRELLYAVLSKHSSALLKQALESVADDPDSSILGRLGLNDSPQN